MSEAGRYPVVPCGHLFALRGTLKIAPLAVACCAAAHIGGEARRIAPVFSAALQVAGEQVSHGVASGMFGFAGPCSRLIRRVSGPSCVAVGPKATAKTLSAGLFPATVTLLPV